MRTYSKEKSLKIKRKIRRNTYLRLYGIFKKEVKDSIRMGETEFNLVPFSGWGLELNNYENNNHEKIAVRLFLRKNPKFKTMHKESEIGRASCRERV